MKIRGPIVIFLVAAMIASVLAIYSRHHQGTLTSQPVAIQSEAPSSNLSSSAAVSQATTPPQNGAAAEKIANSTPLQAEASVSATNKLQRLKQIRETFVGLAGGDPAMALRAAKQIGDETERETALLTLVTEWTQGRLRSPKLRAAAIQEFGIDVGLGFELGTRPDLAVLWANELTDGPARTTLLHFAANHFVTWDQSTAFGLADQVPEADRRKFIDSVFADWGSADTDAALNYANQLPDSAQRDAAIAAIRTAAPVGIGAALKMEDGYPVITQLLPGTPAERSGQLRPGDRILALAQGDNLFTDMQGLDLQTVVTQIRGAPNTILQLQVLASDAGPGAAPRIVTIPRDQIRFRN